MGVTPPMTLASWAIGVEVNTGGGAGGATLSTETAATMVDPLADVDGEGVGGAAKGGATKLGVTKLGAKPKFGGGELGDIGVITPEFVVKMVPPVNVINTGAGPGLEPGVTPNPNGPPIGLDTIGSGGNNAKGGGGPEGLVGGGGGAVVVNT